MKSRGISTYLDLLRVRLLACFGLTEPNHGSDPAHGNKSKYQPESDVYILNGSKNWITNYFPIADVFIIWAQTENGLRGLSWRREMKGLTAPKIEGKLLQSLITG